jgi:hypothetical protein
MHLTGGCDESNHAFANFQAVAGAVHFAACTAMGARKRQFATLFVVQVDVRIHTSERSGYLVHNLIHELVEVKNRADFLSGLLHLEKIFHLIQVKIAGD